MEKPSFQNAELVWRCANLHEYKFGSFEKFKRKKCGKCGLRLKSVLTAVN